MRTKKELWKGKGIQEQKKLQYNYNRPQRSCCKVIFSQASVILFTGEGVWCVSARGCGRPPSPVHAGIHTPPAQWVIFLDGDIVT